MNVFVLFVLATSAAAPTATPTAPTAPLVSAFARLHGTPSLDDLSAGRLLLGELNCTSCHTVDAGLKDHLTPKTAPILSNVGDRVRPEHIRKLLNSPQSAKPGTTMPDVLAGLSAKEKEHQVEALTHFLASTATEPLRDRFVDKGAVGRGAKLFNEVGCAACHGSRDPKAEPLAFAVPLGDPASKYTVTSLAQFVREPAKVRPSGRMPSLKLTADEARDVASYFLKDVPGDPNVRYTYYEGRWNTLPDFNLFKPVGTGTATGFDVGVAKAKDRFAIRFEGYLHLDKDVNNEFRITSDDGARLYIDDVLIVNNDGVHEKPKTTQVRSIVKAGTHKVRVDYFVDRGDRSLLVEMFPPRDQPQNLASLLTIDPEPKPAKKDALKIDSALVAEGRKLFASSGCASCHELKVGPERIASALKPKSLKQLAVNKGCTADAPAGDVPNFLLTATQKKTLDAALAWAAEAALLGKPEPPTAAVKAKHMLAAFNCYACHRRDNIGGVDMTPGLDLNDDGVPDVDPTAEKLAKLFHGTIPEMGDEGRLPPRLDGVGAKLTDKYLKQIVANGGKDRPYMRTVMPEFGANNTGPLVALFQTLDTPYPQKLPPPVEPDYRMNAAGRPMVGTKGFSCVKCHNFNQQKAEGIPGIDMTVMTQRVRPEWFLQYVRDPQKMRPGTRMPTVFPLGKSPLPDLLDGDVDQQIAGLWTFLSDGQKAAMPVGVGGQPIELIAKTEPLIYRNFIADVGPRAIGVAYPEKANLAFDANDLRPALIWHGAFIDAAKHWTGRGQGFQGPLGDDIVKLAPGPNLAKLANADEPWPTKTAKELGYQFRGYRLGTDRRPAFLYDAADVRVTDDYRPVKHDKHPGLLRTVTLTQGAAPGTTVGDKPEGELWFRAVVAQEIKATADGWYLIDGMWRVRIVAGGEKSVIRSGPQGKELLVRATLVDGRGTIEQEFAW